MLIDLNGYLQSVLEWPEKHAGLGGWVGALGAIVAVFVGWLIARNEYLRNQRQAAARLKAEMVLMLEVVIEFEVALEQFVNFFNAEDSRTEEYKLALLDEPQYTSLQDLAELRVNAWPSLESYRAFRKYWLASNRLLDSTNIKALTEKGRWDAYKERGISHNKALDRLKNALSGAYG
jgi:hypothetical protein